MGYVPTGKPNGRPRKYAVLHALQRGQTTHIPWEEPRYKFYLKMNVIMWRLRKKNKAEYWVHAGQMGYTIRRWQ